MPTISRVTTLRRTLVGVYLCGCFLIGALNRTAAQTPSTLGVQLYAGVTITGAVGTVYAIQSTANPVNTNSWTTVNFIRLPNTNYLWTDTSAAATGQRFYRAVTFVLTNLVFIPAGSFRMGSPAGEVGRVPSEGPQTLVTLTKGFFMGKNLVTQAEYQTLMATNPSQFSGDLSHPVERVSWNDATNYCARLTQQELAGKRIPPGSLYRLPTEAEWEYACRAGSSDWRYFYGDDPTYSFLSYYAWYNANSGGATQPVGQKLPNPWGLYDMIGNVWAWVLDWDGIYPGGSVIDPQGPATGTVRQMRGGCWNCTPQYCRSAMREPADPALGLNNFGLRVVLAPGP
ncbi:MAG: formylglycine-generating enzyme family protein [Verrucomicrobiota bacterium]